MLKLNATLAAALVVPLAFLATPQATSTADAYVIIPFFTPIADCGTVDIAQGFYDFDGDGEPDSCVAWYADSGGAYLLDGLDNYNVGDRIFVEGLVCNTCLTTCAAGAIFDATISACPKK